MQGKNHELRPEKNAILYVKQKNSFINKNNRFQVL